MKAAILVGVLGGGLGMLAPVTAAADWFQHGFSVALNTDYDTNPNLSASADDDLWRFTASPAYNLSRSSGPDSLNLRLALALERSSDAAVSIGREDPSLSLAWTRQSATGSFGVTAGYVEASTRLSEFENLGLVTVDGSKITRSLGLKWSRALDARRTLALNADHAGVRYRGGTLTDYANLSASATLSDTWNERQAPYLRFAVSHYAPETGGADSDSIDLLAGINLVRSERLSLDLAAGINQTSTLGNRDTGWQGSVKFNYALDPRSAFSFDLARSTLSSGLGGFVETDQMNLRWNRALSDTQSIGIDLALRDSESVTTGNSRQFSLWGSRALNDFWSLRLQYLYRQSAGNGVPEASGSVLSLSLSYAHPDFLDL